MMFNVNHELLSEARTTLWNRQDIYWIIGGSCSGKSTVSRELAGKSNIPIYDMDAYVFSRYFGRYNYERHPASMTWFSAPDPLDWALSLSWDEFASLYKAANAEYLSLLAEDYRDSSVQGPQIIDGGITHPSVLVQAVRPESVVCLNAPEEERSQTWETSEERLIMKRQVLDLPDGDSKWSRFLEFDKLITETIINECYLEKIKIVTRGDGVSVEEVGDQILGYFGLEV